MEYVTLANGVKMPELGYGVYQVTKEECERCVSDALEVGYITAYNRAVAENTPIITVDGWQDGHPLLKLIPTSWNDSIPFGVFYSPNPTKLVKKFIGLLSEIAAR